MVRELGGAVARVLSDWASVAHRDPLRGVRGDGCRRERRARCGECPFQSRQAGRAAAAARPFGLGWGSGRPVDIDHHDCTQREPGTVERVNRQVARRNAGKPDRVGQALDRERARRRDVGKNDVCGVRCDCAEQRAQPRGDEGVERMSGAGQRGVFGGRTNERGPKLARVADQDAERVGTREAVESFGRDRCGVVASDAERVHEVEPDADASGADAARDLLPRSEAHATNIARRRARRLRRGALGANLFTNPRRSAIRSLVGQLQQIAMPGAVAARRAPGASGYGTERVRPRKAEISRYVKF